MKFTRAAGIALLAVASVTPVLAQNQIRFYGDGRLACDPPLAVGNYAPDALLCLAEEQPPPAAAPAAEAAPPADPAPPPPPAVPAAPPVAKPENATSPSDAPPPPVAVAPKVELERQLDKPAIIEDSLDGKDKAGYGEGCSCGRCGGGWFACYPDKRWNLPQPGFLQRHKAVLGGWVQQGVTFNDQGNDGFNGPVATNDMAGEYQLNQMWMYLNRPADTGGCGFAWGGRIDMIYGTDWRFGINHGLEDRINGFDNQKYGLVIPQAYLELAYNNLSVKLGHFAAILDYEMVPGPFNPFYSHSYSYAYTVPQLVTGALADWKMTDQFSVQAGFHRGREMFEDFNDELEVMAGVKWVSADKGTSIAYAISSGPQTVNFPPAGNSPAGFYFNDDNRFVYSLVVQQKITEKLKYVLVQNLGVEDGAQVGAPPATPPSPPIDAEWYGLNNYLLYQINPCWSANLRAEWLRDDDGVRVAGPGNIPGVYAWPGAGYAGNFYDVTLGLNWRPNGNWLVRPEVRFDWYDGLPSPKPGNALPFGNGTSDNQTTVAVDAVFLF